MNEAESNGLCYWHDPDTVKTGDDIKQRLSDSIRA